MLAEGAPLGANSRFEPGSQIMRKKKWQKCAEELKDEHEIEEQDMNLRYPPSEEARAK